MSQILSRDRAAIEALLLKRSLGPADKLSVRAVTGGDIHRSYALDFAGHAEPLFAKLNNLSAQHILLSEYQSLSYFSRQPDVRYPQSIAFEVIDERAILLMSWHILERPDAQGSAALGRMLAKQHRITAERFGWQADNFIGLTPQLNAPHEECTDWSQFYAQYRLQPQLEWASRAGLDSELRARIEALCARLDDFFAQYRPLPSLLHGDLWGGNAAFDSATGLPLLYDPAPYFGDRETDLAMTELFGGFSSAFYQAYAAEWPIDPGYPHRKPLYQLYHALNHFNLFGSAYQSMINSLLVGLPD